MQVHHLLEEAVYKHSEKNAVWYQDCWYTYREVNDMANRIASYIFSRGVDKGDRVALLHENSFFYVASYFAILKIGAVVVGLNTETTPDSLEYLLNNSDAKLIISQKRYNKYLIPILDKCPMLLDVFLTDGGVSFYSSVSSITVFDIDNLEIYTNEPTSVRTIDIDLAEIVYTSGSTGKSKGVMLTHLNLITNMKSICAYLKLTENDRIMVVLPFFYIYGKSLLLTHFMCGGSVVIDNRFVFPNKILETMLKMDVTGFSGVPSTFMILLNRSSLKSTVFKSLRYITEAGGSMAPSIQKEVVDIFSPARLYIMYGATEAAPRLSYLEPDQLVNKWGSIGIPVENVDLLVCDHEGNEVPDGVVGEITARGSNIMKGYWKDPEETGQVLKLGMYFTGDLGRKDEDGFFYVVGRSKDMIKVKGFRVGAKEIEELILEIDEIHETAVVGVDDPILGEAILALVVPKEKGWNDSDLIRQKLQKKLSQIKVPKYIEFRESFPKNKSGKIMKMKIKEEENKVSRGTL